MLHEIKRYWNLKSPLTRFSIALFIYISLALVNLLEFSTPSWWLYSNNEIFYKSLFSLISIFFVIDAFYILNYYIFKFKNINPIHLGISGAIIYLLIHPTENFWVFSFITLIMIFTKLIVRWKGKPLFNPAAFAIIISYYILGAVRQNDLQITWWGTDFGLRNINIGQISISIFPIIFSAIFFYFAYKFRKHIYGLSFFLAFICALFIYSFLNLDGITLSIFFQLLLIGLPTWVFLIFVMLVEPKTSPVQKKDQITLGLFGGVLYFLFLKYAKDLKAPELHVIVFLNLITFLFFSTTSQVKQWIIKRTTKVRVIR